MRSVFHRILGLVVLAGCSGPPPEAYVLGGSAASAPSAVAIGNNARGEPCRMIRSGSSAEVFCGEWGSPSARIRRVPAAPIQSLAAQAMTVAQGRMACEPGNNTTVLGSRDAVLMSCRRQVGGWESFVLVTNAGNEGFQADGVIAALQPAERAIGVLAGLVQPDAELPRSAAVDMMAARLARASFGANDIAAFEQMMSVGQEANQAERFVAAELAYRGALGAQERFLGAGAPDTVGPMLRLALQLSNQGRYPEADQLFARAAPLSGRASDPIAPALLAHYIALHEANRGQSEKALAELNRAEGLYARELPPGLRTGVSRAAGQVGSIDSAGMIADPLVLRALVGTVEVRRNRAAVLRALGRQDDASSAAQAAEALTASAPGMAATDLISARVARTSGAVAVSGGSHGRASGEFGRSAARFARAVPRSRPYADTLLLQAAASTEADSSPSSILRICREAVSVLRALREGTSASAISPCVNAFAESARRAGGQALLAEAFEASQLAQGNVTTTQIARAAARLTESVRNPAAAAALRRREETGRQLAALYRDRDDASAAAGRGSGPDLATLDRQISEAQDALIEADQAAQSAAPGYAQLMQSAATASEVFAALAPGEALAQIFLPPSQPGWTFVLRDGVISAAHITARGPEIEALVARLRASVEDGSGRKPFDADAAHRLYAALFGGVSGALADARTLIVAPSGQLLSVPFSVLVVAQPPAPLGHANVDFLLAKMAVSHVPSPSSMVSLRRAGRSQAPHPWIGFGAPVPVPLNQAVRTFGSAECGRLLASLPALRTAGLELRVSSELIGAQGRNATIGGAFTADAVRRSALKDYRILHFATHGLLPADLACLQEATIIASTQAGSPNASAALLSAGAFLDLELDADLVVLSACNSGGGAAAGESLSGLARSLFYAGARSLLVTHWFLDDASATRIVALTMRNLQLGQSGAEAIRNAQLDYARNVAEAGHPAFWGAFGLVGPGPSGQASRAASEGIPRGPQPS